MSAAICWAAVVKFGRSCCTPARHAKRGEGEDGEGVTRPSHVVACGTALLVSLSPSNCFTAVFGRLMFCVDPPYKMLSESNRAPRLGFALLWSPSVQGVGVDEPALW